MGASKVELRDAIRSRGLRATASRIAVLSLLSGATKPLSHAEVVEALEAETWDRATLYRNLVDLVDAGLAQKVELGDRVWRFGVITGERAHDGTLHPHFVCTMCGDVACLPDLSFKPPSAKVPKALRALDVEVHVRGVCDSCQA